jgi:MFS family permease
MVVVLIAFLVIGIALPVLPLHVHQDLGFGAFIVGLVTRSQFGASLLSRVSAGHCADKRGPKRAVVIGLLTAIAGVASFWRCTARRPGRSTRPSSGFGTRRQFATVLCVLRQ